LTERDVQSITAAKRGVERRFVDISGMTDDSSNCQYTGSPRFLAILQQSVVEGKATGENSHNAGTRAANDTRLLQLVN